MKTWVYIAGPYSQPNPVRNMRHAMQVWFTLYGLGYHSVCPHWTGFQDFLTPMLYEDWLEYDRQTLTRCDVILRLPGLSSGADAEVKYAVQLGKPVVHSLAELLTKFPVNVAVQAPTPVESGKE